MALYSGIALIPSWTKKPCVSQVAVVPTAPIMSTAPLGVARGPTPYATELRTSIKLIRHSMRSLVFACPRIWRRLVAYTMKDDPSADKEADIAARTMNTICSYCFLNNGLNGRQATSHSPKKNSSSYRQLPSSQQLSYR